MGGSIDVTPLQKVGCLHAGWSADLQWTRAALPKSISARRLTGCFSPVWTARGRT